MRLPILVAVALATTAILAVAPAEARGGCTSATNADCDGVVCLSGNAATGYRDCVGTICHYQSDCCHATVGSSFWCPDEW